MTDRLTTIADQLARDWSTRAPYRKLELADRDEAYAVAGLLQQRMIAVRGPIAGRKIALSSKAMQEMVNLDSPVAGAIFANDVRCSPAQVPLSGLRHMGLEYELAFELARGADPGQGPFTAETALALVGGVRPAFEMVDDKDVDYSNICGLTLTADNAWCGGVVVGDAIEGWRDLDLNALPVTLHQDGMEPEHATTGAASPLESLAWVLNHVTGRGGRVSEGEIVITGSVMRTRFPKVGDRLRYEIDGLASVEIEVV